MLALGLSTACSFGSATGDADAEGATSLTLATPYPITDLSPAASGYWAPEFGYGELLMRAHDDGSIEPWLLESLESTSPTTWLLTLRDGVTFQNGNALDAEALSALLNHHLKTNEDLKAVAPGGKATTLSDLEVELTTKRPAGGIPSAFAHELMTPIFDLEAAKRAGENVEKQIGARFWTGPFIVTEITNDAMSMTANEDYWGGVPELKDVQVRFIPDPQARVLAVQSGEADLALYPDSTTSRALEGSSDAVFITSEVPHSSVRMILNLEDPALQDLDVRRAVSLGVDYEALAEQVMPAVYEVGAGMYPMHLDFAESIQSTDVERAKALLEDAGWREGAEGYRERDGRRLSLTFVVDEQVADLQSLALALQDQLSKIGVEVKIQEVADIYETTSADDWGATFLMSNVFGADYVGDAQRFLASDGRLNLGHIDDPELDRLIDQALAETDTDATAELLRQIQRRVGDQAYGIYPAERRSSAVAAKDWERYDIPMNNLWVDAETTAAGS